MASQFGIEYAGAGAIAGASQLLAAGGQLVLVLHLLDGVIHRECASNLESVSAVQEINLMPLAREAFTAGFALNDGSGSVEQFKTAERAFTPAVRGLEQLLQRYGSAAAGGLLDQLYADIAQMYSRMSSYEPAEIIAWIDGMVRELEAYRGRMSSMVDAALGVEGINAIQRELESAGMHVVQRTTLDMGPEALPAAWVLAMERG